MISPEEKRIQIERLKIVKTRSFGHHSTTSWYELRVCPEIGTHCRKLSEYPFPDILTEVVDRQRLKDALLDPSISRD